MHKKPTEEDRQAVRLLVRARDDFQSMRKRMDNRIGRKADKTEQDIEHRTFRPEHYKMLAKIAQEAKDQEDEVEKKLKKVLKNFPIYTEWLSKVKGVGTIAAGWIIAEFDIHKASTVSKMTQFAGMNPGMVEGKKRKENKDGSFTYVSTGEMIRGDKLTPGFVAPFNKRLRTALLGVMADGFIKAQNNYCRDVYYALHIPEDYRKDKKAMQKRPELAGQYGRLDLSEDLVLETKKGGKQELIPWKDTTDSHRNRAAKRKMVKVFLQDLYQAWRTIEGLPVRKPYQEEYLGHVHEDKPGLAKRKSKSAGTEARI